MNVMKYGIAKSIFILRAQTDAVRVYSCYISSYLAYYSGINLKLNLYYGSHKGLCVIAEDVNIEASIFRTIFYTIHLVLA